MGRQRRAGAEAVTVQPRAASCPIPADSALYPAIGSAYFTHCASIDLPRAPASALEAYRDIAALVPGWFEGLMTVRNRAMRLLGMKDLGHIRAVGTADDVQVGERAGIFTVFGHVRDELVLGDEDRHLRVSLSLQLKRGPAPAKLYCATVVERPNRLGRLYMLPVDPIHRLIVPCLLQRYARRLRDTSDPLPEDMR
ncbi:DUF2867 domain-containing protein [Pseudoxanthomonas sp. PXM01]|nr:DUF2867 domain-containing protein [Pseudoxanthomonas sp. PXM01]MBD9470129.1 DUF2867 domain-containing protein [Pseudoxanthomonas sp. PXM01]